MAYTITFDLDIASDRLSATITDTTTYGGANPDRADVRVFMSGQKINTGNSVYATLTVTGDQGDAQTDSIFTTNLPRDGHYKWPFVIIKEAYSGGDTYSLYEAVYDSSNNNVYRSKQNSNTGNALSDTDWWELISDPSSLALNKGEANESTNIESTVYQRVLLPNGEYGYGNFLSDQACDCDCDPDCSTYHTLSLLVNAAVIADTRSELVAGEEICRRIDAILLEC